MPDEAHASLLLPSPYANSAYVSSAEKSLAIRTCAYCSRLPHQKKEVSIVHPCYHKHDLFFIALE